MGKIIQVLIVISCGLFLQACTDTNQSAEHAVVIERLDALDAESEIRHKLQTYMEVLDAADWDTYVDYFTYDAKLIMSEGTRVGRDDIKERMATASARMAKAAEGQPARKGADLLANIEVRVDGDTATAQSRFTFIGQNDQGGFDVRGSGLYIDEWAKEGGQWRISAREIDYDLLNLGPLAD